MSAYYDAPLPPELADVPLDPDALEAEQLRPPEDPERWRIRSDAEAEWALRRLAKAKAAAAEIATQAGAWRERISSWERTALHPHDRDRNFFRAHLLDYGRRRREDTGKATLALPSGSVTSRHRAQPRAVVVKADEFCDWARNTRLDSLVRTTYAPDRKALAEAATIKLLPADDDGPERYVVLVDGEVVPGVEVEGPDTSFSVSPS